MRHAISVGFCTLISLSLVSATALAQPVMGTVSVGGQVTTQPVQQVLPPPQGQVYVQQQQPVMQPIYVQPQYVQQQPVVYVAPPPPPGRSLIVAGATTFGILYGISLVTGSIALGINSPDAQFGGAMLLIPVVGPFVTAAVWAPVGTPFMIINGIAQGAGLGMLIAGAVISANAARQQPQPTMMQPRMTWRERRANTNHIDWSIAPVASPTMTGAMLSLSTF